MTPKDSRLFIMAYYNSNPSRQFSIENEWTGRGYRPFRNLVEFFKMNYNNPYAFRY